MNKLVSVIQAYYLNPEHFIYKTISKINHHYKKIVLVVASVLLFYPIMKAVNLAQQVTKLDYKLKNSTIEITEKERLLQAKLAEKGNRANTDLTPTKINQQLENLFQQQQVEINNMQWELEQDKQIHITLTQKAKTLFDVMQQLNKISYLRIKEITLTRLDYQQLVQLNVTLQLVKQ